MTDPGAPPVALVTGAAGGLGRSIVERLTAVGWRVAPAVRRDGEWAADAADSGAVERLVGRVVERFGRLDLLVVNHATLAMGPIDEQPVEDWWRVVEVDLSGAFYFCRASAPALRASGGSIVLVSSEWGVTGMAGATAYAASKAGLIGLTRALARELAPAVRVNAIAPGVVDTPQLRVDAAWFGVSLDELRRRYAAAIPLRRVATAAEIAETVLFLVSPGGAFYTGQVFHPNGGTTMAS